MRAASGTTHCLVLATLLCATGAGGQPTRSTPSTPGPGAGGDALVVAAVESFHSALAAGDEDTALDWLDPRVVIFEAGGAELSRDEYAAHHLEADIAFASATKTAIVAREVRSLGDTGWVLTRTRTTGTFRGHAVNSEGVETMVLQRSDGRWRIVHIHWSSRS